MSIFRAAETGDYDRVEELLDSGLDVNLQDKGGGTALYFASWYGHTAIVKLLLEKGANVDLQDKYDNGPLHWATNNGHMDIIDLLTRPEQIKEWRPWNNSDLPKPFRQGMTNLMLLAKMIYK